MKKYMKKLVLLGVAILLAGLIFLAADRDKEKTGIYDVVFMGDSVIGNYADPFGVTTVMEERLGKTVFNGALGGTCMSVSKQMDKDSVPVRHWSMVKLAYAMCTDDWTSQMSGVSYSEHYYGKVNQILEYFYERLTELSQIDFSEVEILLIEHGTNDYNSGQLLDSEEDPYDITTYGGALRTTVSMLQKKFPELRIILVSPVYCEFAEMDGANCTETDLGGGVLDEYVQMQKSVAQEYGLEWIDLYYSSGIWTDTIDIYTYDKLHLTREGQQLIGDLISEYLESNVVSK